VFVPVRCLVGESLKPSGLLSCLTVFIADSQLWYPREFPICEGWQRPFFQEVVVQAIINKSAERNEKKQCKI